jgi:hypothetical protein
LIVRIRQALSDAWREPAAGRALAVKRFASACSMRSSYQPRSLRSNPSPTGGRRAGLPGVAAVHQPVALLRAREGVQGRGGIAAMRPNHHLAPRGQRHHGEHAGDEHADQQLDQREPADHGGGSSCRQ